MREIKPSLQWAEETLRSLSEQGFTGIVTIRISQGGVQGIAVNQELCLRPLSTAKTQFENS